MRFVFSLRLMQSKRNHHQLFVIQMIHMGSSNKNYQAPHSSSKPTTQQIAENILPSVSSHSDIFNKVDQRKLNLGK